MRERPIASRALVALVASLAFSCTRPNPLYHPLGDGGAGNGGGNDGAAGTGGGGGAGGGKGGSDGGSDAMGGPCNTGDVQSCYSGAATTIIANITACHAGVQYCINGVWQACVGEVLPTAAEACNGIDDDCNQSTDDGFPKTTCGLGVCAKSVDECLSNTLAVCVPGAPAAEICNDNLDNNCDGVVDEGCPGECVRVSSLTGSDATLDGTVSPFATIQAAIDWASSGNGRPKMVCVAGGADCATPVTYQLAASATITMRNGISVYGNFESTGWTRCPLGAGSSVTVTIAPGAATGIVFPSMVSSATALDGVRIARLDQGETTAAVTVDGAKQVTLSNLFIDDAPSVAASTYGVDLKNAATATITRSLILGGAGATAAVGVRSVGATPVIRENCTTFNATSGNCAADCAQPLGIRGRSAGTGAVASSSAVQLQDSAGAIVDRNTLCGGPAAQGDALRIAGASKGIAVRGNTIIASGATVEAHGIRLDGCAAAGPWIAGNELIQADAASATANLSAVSAIGSCHPIIDRNVRIVALGEVGMGPAAGVSCGVDGVGDISLCVVVGNKIQGSAGTHPSTATGIACKGGACGRIGGNIVNGIGGGDVVGVSLAGGGTRVERNMITGGCGQNSAVGLRADDTHAFIVNNLVLGSSCAGSVTPPLAIGVQMRVAASGINEAEVHSNTIDAGGIGACQGAAGTVNAAVAPTAAAGPLRRGIFRNNILRAGACDTAFDFREETLGVSPRLLENNDFDPVPLPTGLYFNNSPLIPGGQTVKAILGVNSLTFSKNNISGDPMFVLYPTNLQLAAQSVCVDAGTMSDAPSNDYAGKLRTGMPDIGAYEH